MFAMSTIKKSVYLGLLLLCVIVFMVYIALKMPFINSDQANTAPSQPEEEFSSLKTWIGEYSFSEYAPPNQNMFYLVTIHGERNNVFAQFSIDGFQRSERLTAKVSGDASSVDFEFLHYLPGNTWEPYEKGDILLSFKKSGSKLITSWGKLQPLLLENQEAGEYFQLLTKNVLAVAKIFGRSWPPPKH